eukprot:COSAG01_NODE_14836_length_1404_cov_6.091954_2_plen_97_part_00
MINTYAVPEIPLWFSSFHSRPGRQVTVEQAAAGAQGSVRCAALVREIHRPGGEAGATLRRASKKVRPNGCLLGRRGRSLPASASGVGTHRDSITST